jgi:DNA-binding response OmpR family regulator
MAIVVRAAAYAEAAMTTTGQAAIRLAVVDSDSGFLQVLTKRLDTAGWQHRVLASPVPLDTLVAMRLNAVVLDLAVLGPQAWTYLEKLCVEAVVRRRKRADTRTPSAPVVIGELEIRADQFQAFAAGVSVDLTRREFELIQLLAEAEGQVLQREEIYQRVWGYAMAHGDRSVDVFVRKLRQKLERASPRWRYIHTHFGIGYRFAPETAAAGGAAEAEETGLDPAEAGAEPAPEPADLRG